MSLDCGRKPEYPVRTHACTGRTCKLHARPLAESRTQDLLAARQQCYQLCHRAAPTGNVPVGKQMRCSNSDYKPRMTRTVQEMLRARYRAFRYGYKELYSVARSNFF
ncbi:hypothetical protein ILYODFUR_025369 [Ilyodon furcidens]|uniref:Uncharacterized protein n=1 Tax=Ilyodon furcidens TaxID=33524 RepID=A0ABV0V7M9_9TELE